MNPELKKLQDQIDKLQEQLDFLKNTTTIPYEVDTAFHDRLGTYFVELQSSSKTVASESRSVNEAGTNTYSVAKPMDGFEQRTVAGQVRYYPYYT